jgi:hypothetical protein
MEPRITNKAEFMLKVSEAILTCTNISDMSDCSLMVVNDNHLLIRSSKNRWWAELKLRKTNGTEGEDGK